MSAVAGVWRGQSTLTGGIRVPAPVVRLAYLVDLPGDSTVGPAGLTLPMASIRVGRLANDHARARMKGMASGLTPFVGGSVVPHS